MLHGFEYNRLIESSSQKVSISSANRISLMMDNGTSLCHFFLVTAASFVCFRCERDEGHVPVSAYSQKETAFNEGAPTVGFQPSDTVALQKVTCPLLP